MTSSMDVFQKQHSMQCLHMVSVISPRLPDIEENPACAVNTSDRLVPSESEGQCERRASRSPLAAVYPGISRPNTHWHLVPDWSQVFQQRGTHSLRFSCRTAEHLLRETHPFCGEVMFPVQQQSFFFVNANDIIGGAWPVTHACFSFIPCRLHSRSRGQQCNTLSENPFRVYYSVREI